MTKEELIGTLHFLLQARPHEGVAVPANSSDAELGLINAVARAIAPPKRAARSASSKTDVLNEALKTVADRGESYGTVEENFNRIARLWNSHLVNRGIVDDPRIISDPEAHNGVTATDVAMMMSLVKIARLELDDQHHDSWVDLAGYAACGGELGAKGRNSA